MPLSPRVNQFYFSQIRLGSRADSYYESVFTETILTDLYKGKSEHVYKEMYDEACKGIKRHLVKISQGPKKLIHTIELAPSRRDNRPEYRPYNKQDHLVCFLPGLLMLGVHQGKDELDQKKMTIQEHENWWVGTELLKTCYDTYNSTERKIKTIIESINMLLTKAEIIHFHPIGDPLSLKEDWFIKRSENSKVDLLDGRYILRPETVESIFIAFRLTGDAKYREWGWQIFQSIEKHAKIQTGGYASIKDVDQLPVVYEDKMETFLLSETFKYLYLLFEDSTIAPLDIFNTEAHLFPIFEPSFKSNLI
ncbi:glycoside hydrolase [Wallemia mellicola]|nr:glycoside hydrolase [Wallemia mellicola]